MKGIRVIFFTPVCKVFRVHSSNWWNAPINLPQMADFGECDEIEEWKHEDEEYLTTKLHGTYGWNPPVSLLGHIAAL